MKAETEQRGELRLAIGMIQHAIKDLRGMGVSRQRLSAAAWLASAAATPWFDYVGVDQRFALERMVWRDYAADILEKAKIHEKKHPDKPLHQGQLRVIAETLERLR